MARGNKPQIRVKLGGHRGAIKAAAAYKMALGECTEAARDYCPSRQLNPVADVARAGQLLRQQVKKLGDQVVSSLLQQERSLLLPRLEQMLRTRTTLDHLSTKSNGPALRMMCSQAAISAVRASAWRLTDSS